MSSGAARPLSRSTTAARRALRRGLTLIEIIVVMTIVALVCGAAVAGSNQLPSARLRRTATMLSSAIKVAYTRATATSRDLRLVMDLDARKVWLEESERPMLAQSKDKSATGGADPVTVAETAAIAEGARIMNGPAVPKARFHPIEAYGFGDVESGKGGKPLQRGIEFRTVQTSHDDQARKSGRAYLYFWPGGRTERAAIQLQIGDETDDDHTLTVLVAPLTGKVTIKGGAVDLVVPTDDQTASDRQDTTY